CTSVPSITPFRLPGCRPAVPRGSPPRRGWRCPDPGDGPRVPGHRDPWAVPSPPSTGRLVPTLLHPTGRLDPTACGPPTSRSGKPRLRWRQSSEGGEDVVLVVARGCRAVGGARAARRLRPA